MVPAGIPAPYGGADEPLAGRAAGSSAGAGTGALTDAGHPARRRMAAMLKSAGVKGMTVRGIAEQLAADGQQIAQQTIYRWLTEEAAAGHVENASYGRWKWRGDRPA